MRVAVLLRKIDLVELHCAEYNFPDADVFAVVVVVATKLPCFYFQLFFFSLIQIDASPSINATSISTHSMRTVVKSQL